MEPLVDLDIDGKYEILLKQILENQTMKAWTRMNCLGKGLKQDFVNLVKNTRVPETQDICQETEE